MITALDTHRYRKFFILQFILNCLDFYLLAEQVGSAAKTSVFAKIFIHINSVGINIYKDSLVQSQCILLSG